MSQISDRGVITGETRFGVYRATIRTNKGGYTVPYTLLYDRSQVMLHAGTFGHFLMSLLLVLQCFNINLMYKNIKFRRAPSIRP